MTAGISSEVRKHTPRALCQECGDDEVMALCCNCAGFLCSRHSRVADLEELRRLANSLLRRRIHRRYGGPDALDRVPAPNEFPARPNRLPRMNGEDQFGTETDTGSETGAAEPKAVQRRHFCSSCLPAGHLYDVHVVAASAAALLGVALMMISTVMGTAVLVTSACWLGVRLCVGLVRRRRRGRRYRGLLFLAPRIRKLELTETVEGRCELDRERRETLSVNKVEGTIDVGLRWTNNHAAHAERHRRRFRPELRPRLRAEAGHLVLRGAGQLDLKHPPGCEVTHPARVCMHPYLADHELLTSPDGRGDARWDFSLTYKPSPPAEGWRLPVWVTPSFAPDSDRKALDLRVQWCTIGPITDPDDGPELTAKELSRVVLEVPGTWGTVRGLTLQDVEQTLVGQAPGGKTRIEWKKAAIPQASRGSCELSAEFSRQIDESATVTGEVEIAFTEAISGITDVQTHSPGGGRRRDGVRPKIKTKMFVRFELSLAGMRHQQFRTIPHVADDGKDSETHRFPNTRPDQHLVVGLVQQLADDSYLVKSVVEHPIRPGRGVGLHYRVWDITGRRYKGVYPIDFRITVAGDEAEAGASSSSTTSIRLIVKGVHASPTMNEEIVKAYEEIWARIEASVEASEAGADGNLPRREGEPFAAIGKRAAQLKATLLSVSSVLGEAEQEGSISTELAERFHDALEFGRPGGA
jgi:hypothetical protein